MNIKSREEWWLISGLISLLIMTGCTTGKTAEKTAAKPTEVAAASSPVIPLEAVPKEMAAAPVAGTSYFVANDNIKTVYFDLNTSQLNEASQDVLKKNAEWLEQNPPMLVQIAGYADSRGSLKRNRTLAERRAEKVRTFYAMLGIPKDRVMILTLGPEEPTCAELSEECLAKSRRVETMIESKPIAPR
jgi:outer membrane protein OmpA-like peptidoglycan-associated protein